MIEGYDYWQTAQHTHNADIARLIIIILNWTKINKIKKMQCLDFYSQFLHNPTLLAQGHHLIRLYLQQSQANRQATLLNLFLQSPPVLALVSNVYATDVFPFLDQGQKMKTRQYLVGGLWKMLGTGKGYGLSKIGVGVLAMMRKMHNEEGYDKWLGLYAQLIENTPKQHIPNLLISILQQSDPRISPLSTQIFTYTITQLHQSTQSGPQQILQILYYCLRSFAHLTGTDDATLQKYFQPYQDHLLTYVWAYIESSPLSIKFAFKILTVLYGDMNRFGETDEKMVPKLLGLGMQLSQQYLKRMGDKNFTNQCIEQGQEQEAQNSLQSQLGQILSQYIQLCQILLQNSQVHPIQLPILLISLILEMATKSEILYWNSNTDQYLIGIEDQYERTIRNRANQIIIKLIENTNNKDKLQDDLRTYFTLVAFVVNGGDFNKLQEFFDKRNWTGVKVNLPNDVFLIEQSSYFLLASVLQTLYPDPQPLIEYLCNRSKACSQVLLKISITFTLQNELREGRQTNLISHILSSINNQSQIYERKQDIGLALVLARAIGKVASFQTIEIGVNLKPQFLILLVQYLGGSRDVKPDEDGTHIILELFLKLTETNPNNKSCLAKVITPQLQAYMINNYMHDGLLSSIVMRILDHYPHQETVNMIVNSLLSGQIAEQKYSELLVKWLQKQIFQLNQSHMLQLLQVYTNKRRQIITPLLKYYLTLAKANLTLLTPQIKTLLNQDTDQVLLVPLLKCAALENIQAKLILCAHDLAFQQTSQYEIERKMMMLFYVGIYQPANLRVLLARQQGLYEGLMEKILRYCRLFQGQHIRLITSIWLLKLSEADKSLISKIGPILESYGQLEVNEWQDEQNELKNEEEQDILQKLLNCKLENEEVEKQLYQIFREFIDGGIGSAYVQQKKQEYGIK